MIFCKYWRSFSAGTKREYMLNSKYGGTTDILAMDEFQKNILKFHERLKEDLGNFGIYKHKIL